MLRPRREEFEPARRHPEAAQGLRDRPGGLLDKYGIAARVTFPVTSEVDTPCPPRSAQRRCAR